MTHVAPDMLRFRQSLVSRAVSEYASLTRELSVRAWCARDKVVLNVRDQTILLHRTGNQRSVHDATGNEGRGGAYECAVRQPRPSKCCVGCDTVQADHAPEAGVAQGIFHGNLVRHHGRNQEEVEEGLEEEVERDKEEGDQTTTCTCMDGMR